MQKYTIICLLEEIDEGHGFASTDWPLHTTFVDTFAVDWDVETLKQKLVEVASELRSGSTAGVKDEYFGPNKEIHVVLLKKNDNMKDIHYKLLDKLKSGNLELNDPQFSKEGFLPHATVQKHAQIDVGAEVSINNLVLIDMFPDEDPYQRKVLKKVNLSQLEVTPL
jgi:hypothetical protein